MPNFGSALLEFGYKGKIYFVNPKYAEFLGRRVYPSLRAIPGTVDYVISCVPASEVLGILNDCPQKGVKAVHLFTARFSETGRQDAIELEQEILRVARKHGIRIIGPNCIGFYDPSQGISMANELPKEPGPVALLSQSGGVLRQVPTISALRGVYFSKGISYGNALDLNESDFLEYLVQDPATRIIMMYIEGVKDGRRFFNTLRQATSAKPVIILKGGRGKSGTIAAASHTAAIAGSMRIWETLIRQTRAVSAASIDEMIDIAAAFRFLPPMRGLRAGVIGGGGGGASVLAADECEEAGLEVIPQPEEIREELKRKGSPVWDWIGNPVDMSIDWANPEFINIMLELMARNPNFDLLITALGVPHRGGLEGFSVDAYIEPYVDVKNNLKPLVAVVAERNPGINNYNSPYWKLTYELRTRLIASGIPFYPTLGRAALAARKLIDYYRWRLS